MLCCLLIFCRFPRLNTFIKRALNKVQSEEVETRLRSLSHPLDTVHLGLDDYAANKVREDAMFSVVFLLFVFYLSISGPGYM